jgi:hypothetical protein
METATDRRDAIRFWALRALAMLLSVGAAVSYLHSMGYGMAAGDLIGLRGREVDVAYAQRWAMVWFVTAVCCLGVSGVSGALATSLFGEAEWLPRFVGRFVVATTVSFVLTVVILWVTVSIATASHHSVIR